MVQPRVDLLGDVGAELVEVGHQGGRDGGGDIDVVGSLNHQHRPHRGGDVGIVVPAELGIEGGQGGGIQAEDLGRVGAAEGGVGLLETPGVEYEGELGPAGRAEDGVEIDGGVDGGQPDHRLDGVGPVGGVPRADHGRQDEGDGAGHGGPQVEPGARAWARVAKRAAWPPWEWPTTNQVAANWGTSRRAAVTMSTTALPSSTPTR